jgi:UDP-N-acetylglucosamine 3-dehydrogenase
MTVRVALVGCGTVARTGHLHGLRMSGVADVVAFASRSPGSAERARDAWGSGDATTDWASAVTRDDVDAVHVCVPNALHAEVAAAALEAGKHVLVEKPVATTLADADRLLALQRPGQLLGTCFDGRCSPVMQEVRRQFPDLGELTSVEVLFGHAGPQAWAPDATWFRDAEQAGGGCLLDLGVHVLDAVAWVAGPLVAVEEAELDGPVDEEARVVARLAGGARADLRVSWQLAEPTFSFAFTGTAGSLVVSGGDLLRDGSPVEVPPAQAPRNTAEGFALAVARGGEPVADGRAGRDALAAALAGYASARDGRAVGLA